MRVWGGLSPLLLRPIPSTSTSAQSPSSHVKCMLMLVQVSRYASFETVSRGALMCDVRCTAQIGYSWDSLGIEGADVHNYLSLSERGDTTS